MNTVQLPGREEGVRLKIPKPVARRLVPLVVSAVDLAARLYVTLPPAARTRVGVGPVAAAIRVANMLLVDAAATCDLAAPPEQIELRPGSSGNLVYRCRHTPPHEWTKDGVRTK
jgi:hypothetical protein